VKTSVKNLKKGQHLEDVSVKEETLNLVLRKYGLKKWIGFK
jgi:hypothetical protein